MPSLNQCKKIAVAIQRKNPTAVPFFRGKPGMGKSEACLQIGEELGISPERHLVVHVNNHDVVDFTGVPSIVDGQTVFNPTEMFYRFREGTGAGLIVLAVFFTFIHITRQNAFKGELATIQTKLDTLEKQSSILS